MLMKVSRSGKVKSNFESPEIKSMLLKKSDLDTIFTNNEGFLFKLEDIFGNRDQLNVLYIENTKDLGKVDQSCYDVIISKSGVTGLNQYLDVTEFFVKSTYYNKEKMIIFTLIRP